MVRVLLPVAIAVAALVLGMGSAAAKETEHSGNHDGSDHYIRSTVAALHQQASDRHDDGERDRHDDGERERHGDDEREHHGDGKREHHGDDGHGAEHPALPPPHFGTQQQSGDHQSGPGPIQTISTGTRSPATAQAPPIPLPPAPPLPTPPAAAGTNPGPPHTTNPGAPQRTAPVTQATQPPIGRVTAPAPAPATTPPQEPQQPRPAPGRQFPTTVLIPPLALPAPAIAHAVAGGSISPLPLVVLFLAMGLLLAVLGMRIGRRRTH